MFKFKKYGHWYFLGASALAVFVVWSAVFYIETHRSRVFIYILDVGQGDAIFIEAPNGNQVLIDGGPDSMVIARLGEVMPFWDRSLDLVVLTHPHADHLNGLLEVLKRYDVGLVLETGVNHTIPEYDEWHKLLGNKGIKVAIAKSGQKARLAAGVYLDVLTPFEDWKGKSPKDIHDAMVVLKLVYASATALLMGDAERSLERQLIAMGADLYADVLKVGHHGSKTSTFDEFLWATSPKIAVISAGRRNRYGHPHQEVIDRLMRLGIETLRTDQDGDITFESDGRSFKRVSAVAR
ncbi:MAG: MBL fold metallo-hydrolase [Candidatus Sungbacteria bacterium]|nr:MBL fold metallo-hydrolase [Candidatus Sungbacteria bacterium]